MLKYFDIVSKQSLTGMVIDVSLNDETVLVSWDSIACETWESTKELKIKDVENYAKILY